MAGIAIPNPLHGLYGTMAILVLSNLAYFHTVSFLTASTALKQLDREFEAVSDSFRITSYNVCYTKLLRVAPAPEAQARTGVRGLAGTGRAHGRDRRARAGAPRPPAPGTARAPRERLTMSGNDPLITPDPWSDLSYNFV